VQVFYFDVGENQRGRFLKVYLAFLFCSVHLNMLRVNFQSLTCKELQGMEEDSGSTASDLITKHGNSLRPSNWLQVSEASVTRSRSTIIVPAGNAADDGWPAFRNILVEIHESSQLLLSPTKGSGPPQVSLNALLLFSS